MVTPGDSTGAAAVTAESDSFMKTNEESPDDSQKFSWGIHCNRLHIHQDGGNNPSKLGC